MMRRETRKAEVAGAPLPVDPGAGPAGDLLGGSVHVWHADLDTAAAPPTTLTELWHTLSPDERERADRFRFPGDRDRFVAARGILRSVLGRYTGLEAARVRFRYDGNGKPGLDLPGGGGGPAFNLSHSGKIALIALARARHVGVDVERVREDFPWHDVAPNVFSPPEREFLRRCSAPEPCACPFFRQWTLKEAYLKAVGVGVSGPLTAVTLLPGGEGHDGPWRLHAPAPGPGRRWELRPLPVGAGYAAAVAVEGLPAAACVTFRRWPAAAPGPSPE